MRTGSTLVLDRFDLKCAKARLHKAGRLHSIAVADCGYSIRFGRMARFRNWEGRTQPRAKTTEDTTKTRHANWRPPSSATTTSSHTARRASSPLSFSRRLRIAPIVKCVNASCSKQESLHVRKSHIMGSKFRSLRAFARKH